ncbi:MAG: Jag N-terminal domain-containing protein, partial [Anaerolineae bacterium]
MEEKSERRNVVASGKTVDDAINNGLSMLGVRRDQVDVEIITEGSRGVLGFGAEHARVRLLVKPKPAPKPARPDTSARADTSARPDTSARTDTRAPTPRSTTVDTSAPTPRSEPRPAPVPAAAEPAAQPAADQAEVE